VHVCQRWRQIVFASPRRLDLQIYCTYGTPVRENLGCWPALPIAVDYCIYFDDDGSKALAPPYEDCDDAIAALEHPDRVCSIRMSVEEYIFEDMAMVLRRTFPVLTSLTLQSIKYGNISLPNSFLGGYAPRLQKVTLGDIPFPTFPTFLRSARDLVKLRLVNNGSISAGMMVAGLAALTKLECLIISFERRLGWQTSHPDQGPPTRIVLPALIEFRFVGALEDLEEFVAQTETPQLAYMKITFFPFERVTQVPQVPQLFQFIGRAEYLKLAEFRRARIHFSDRGAHITLDCLRAKRHPCYLNLGVDCSPDWQVSTMTQLLTQLESSPITSNVRHLSVAAFHERPLRGNMDPAEWLVFLRPFTEVETLHWQTCDRLTGLLVTVLGDSTEDMVAEALPALKLLNLEEQPLTSEALKKFITVRQLSGRPVTVDNTRENLPCYTCRYHPDSTKTRKI